MVVRGGSWDAIDDVLDVTSGIRAVVSAILLIGLFTGFHECTKLRSWRMNWKFSESKAEAMCS